MPHLHAWQVKHGEAGAAAVPDRLGRLNRSEADQAHAVGRAGRHPLSHARQALRKDGVPAERMGMHTQHRPKQRGMNGVVDVPGATLNNYLGPSRW